MSTSSRYSQHRAILSIVAISSYTISSFLCRTKIAWRSTTKTTRRKFQVVVSFKSRADEFRSKRYCTSLFPLTLPVCHCLATDPTMIMKRFELVRKRPFVVPRIATTAETLSSSRITRWQIAQINDIGSLEWKAIRAQRRMHFLLPDAAAVRCCVCGITSDFSF
jgi:hypothetical protein